MVQLIRCIQAFGGSGPSRTHRLLAENLERWLGESRDVVRLDFHTGLGPKGACKLMIDYVRRSSLVRFVSLHLNFSPSMNKHLLRLPKVVFVALLLSTLQLAHGQPADSRDGDTNLAHPNQIVTVAVQGYSISGLVTHLRDAKAFKHGIALFPGHPGIMRLREENGQPRFELRGNFLVRSRRHWLDDETLVVVVDAPSDQWATFTQQFRETPRYGADVAALLDETARRYPVQDWTFVGTSEGSISAFHAARMNPGLARRVILTSSVFAASRNGPGLSGVTWEDLKAPLLWVHHENDPCAFTSYRDAQRFAQKSRSPLVTVRGGGPARGGACEAFTAHGFVGIESETVAAMRSWVKTGAVPGDVER